MIRHYQESEHLGPTWPSKRALTCPGRLSKVFPGCNLSLLKDWQEVGRQWLSYPVLFAMCLPLACFDLCLEIYHRITFSLLKIPRVSRAQYFRIDRHRLPYLSWTQKIGCAYCGYANGLLNYAVQIARATEAFFCPIKHKKAGTFLSPPHHQDFAEYGDSHGYQLRVHEFRSIGKPSLKRFTTKVEGQQSYNKGTAKKGKRYSPPAT